MKYPKQETLRLRRLSRPFYFGIFMLEQVEISLVSTAVTPNFLPLMSERTTNTEIAVVVHLPKVLLFFNSNFHYFYATQRKVHRGSLSGWRRARQLFAGKVCEVGNNIVKNLIWESQFVISFGLLRNVFIQFFAKQIFWNFQGHTWIKIFSLTTACQQICAWAFNKHLFCLHSYKCKNSLSEYCPRAQSLFAKPALIHFNPLKVKRQLGAWNLSPQFVCSLREKVSREAKYYNEYFTKFVSRVLCPKCSARLPT